MSGNRLDFSHLEPFYHVPDARLSEGITYVKETDTLLWVDIYRGLIHKLEDRNNIDVSYDCITIAPETYSQTSNLRHPEPSCKESVGVVFPVINGDAKQITDVLFASKFGIGKTSFRDKTWEYILLYTSCPEISEERALRLRSNDGNVSPCGEYLLVGLMNDFPYDVTDEGCIVRVSLNHPRKVEMFWERIKIPNAIHWSRNGDCTYVTDSLDFAIWKLDAKTGERTRLIDVKKYNPDFDSPEPDGSAINHVSSTLFVAVWSTAKIQEYSIESGRLIREFILPSSTPKVSCCVIVGPDLYVTTGNAKTPNGPETTVDSVGGSIFKIPNAVEISHNESSKNQLVW
ncbi:hypothetical protein HG535_0C01760 [Zygotorulaspora mrakii]|uniref:SMP-30/Gluconolactonase/LRE-like region domain-containing protein n=1 Tax=Zygotorulaspora mrakii TaxID=42260 RepID=A0A7H9B038_ZYGMR|nr:uncharacterized protein HG535_0C01760 [Zygotorulaspora mrakii]QLG71827.1 hypothetical protein HG535_0C01760 [Zygotorulaspora mrakii]